MGTHPIFESDFDCLTEKINLTSNIRLFLRVFISRRKMSKYFDIGANLTDPVFNGIYRGKEKHPDDFEAIMNRAREIGMKGYLVTGGTLEDSKNALNVAKNIEGGFSTCGVHPTRCSEFDQSGDAEQYYKNLRDFAKSSDKIKAIGECGLDYDRLHFCPAETQKVWFERQLKLSAEVGKPLFLHMRAAAKDFCDIIAKNKEFVENGGVVHSFDGSSEERDRILAETDFYIGINGCSLKTKENLEVVKDIPLSRLMIETDCPWCEIKATHAGYSMLETFFPTKKDPKKWAEGHTVKGRSEPCHIVQVAEVVAKVKEIQVSQVADAAWENSKKLFKLNL